jgi:hypothetical protein
MRRFSALVAFFGTLALAGCGGEKTTVAPVAVPATDSAPQASQPDEEVAAVRAKLSAEDHAMVDAQEWCAVSTDERLGAMGPPLKLDIKGESVFVCCKGCKRKAEADPDKTLATVASLKANKAAGVSP